MLKKKKMTEGKLKTSWEDVAIIQERKKGGPGQ